MKAVILCGGMGTRLREHTGLKPKPMIEVAGLPILLHIMRVHPPHGMGVVERHGFWHCMDTCRDWQNLEDMWNSGRPPWRIWQ